MPFYQSPSSKQCKPQLILTDPKQARPRGIRACFRNWFIRNMKRSSEKKLLIIIL